MQELAAGPSKDNKRFKSFAWSHPIQALGKYYLLILPILTNFLHLPNVYLYEIVWDEPYALGLLPSALEVRVVDTSGSMKDTFIQTLTEIQKARYLIRSKKGMLFAASVSQLWCIQAIDIPKQRQSLLQQKKFQLALQLTVNTFYLKENTINNN